jgi:hypothetical protein
MCLMFGVALPLFVLLFFFGVRPFRRYPFLFLFLFAFDWVLDQNSNVFRLADASFSFPSFLVKRARRFSGWLVTYQVRFPAGRGFLLYALYD